MSDICTAHPEQPAVYECDGCKKLLCAECIEEGHRLLFCRHCGEMAIPLAGAPATTTELARACPPFRAAREPTYPNHAPTSRATAMPA